MRNVCNKLVAVAAGQSKPRFLIVMCGDDFVDLYSVYGGSHRTKKVTFDFSTRLFFKVLFFFSTDFFFFFYLTVLDYRQVDFCRHVLDF